MERIAAFPASAKELNSVLDEPLGKNENEGARALRVSVNGFYCNDGHRSFGFGSTLSREKSREFFAI